MEAHTVEKKRMSRAPTVKSVYIPIRCDSLLIIFTSHVLDSYERFYELMTPSSSNVSSNAVDEKYKGVNH